jgi:malate dehydrogenase (oxaloacetate-decarboxylating)
MAPNSAVGVTKSTLADQRIVVYGAGSAGMGIARQIRDGMCLIDGLSADEANRRFWCVDRNGLLVESVGPPLLSSYPIEINEPTISAEGECR